MRAADRPPKTTDTRPRLRKCSTVFLLLSSDLPLMLSHLLVLSELLVKIVSLQLVSWAACHLSREYMKAVLEIANECLTIAESFYATRAIVPTRV